MERGKDRNDVYMVLIIKLSKIFLIRNERTSKKEKYMKII